ncbi:hypothetical protein [Roseovarius sp. D0-M9]|uniref:hypothetical protein n=1 Tax=Roseovarius sp. D0-M9 TaxID=3127117 RepID=UPI00300F948A
MHRAQTVAQLVTAAQFGAEDVVDGGFGNVAQTDVGPVVVQTSTNDPVAQIVVVTGGQTTDEAIAINAGNVGVDVGVPSPEVWWISDFQPKADISARLLIGEMKMHLLPEAF